MARSTRDKQNAALLAARIAVAKEVEVVMIGPASDVAIANLRQAQRPDPGRGRLRVGLRARWVGEVGNGDRYGVRRAVPWGLEGGGKRRGRAIRLTCACRGGTGFRRVAEGVRGAVDTHLSTAVVVGLAVDAVEVVGRVEPGQGGDVKSLPESSSLASRVVGYRG